MQTFAVRAHLTATTIPTDRSKQALAPWRQFGGILARWHEHDDYTSVSASGTYEPLSTTPTPRTRSESRS